MQALQGGTVLVSWYCMESRSRAYLITIVSLAFLSLPTAGTLPAQVDASATTEPGKAQTTLKMAPTKFDAKGSRKANMMYMPSSAKLHSQRPELLGKEPEYRTSPRYATITLGNGPRANRVLAVDEPEHQDPKIYLDLNGNGDLTDDNDGTWAERKESNGSSQYSGVWVFQVSWSLANGEVTQGEYGLNFYYSPLRDSIGYYRAGARVGEISIGDKTYEVTLMENDNDGLFNKMVQANQVGVAGAGPTKPVWLMLDGGKYDIRGTFGFEGINYEALVSHDGAQLTMKPSLRQIKVPRQPRRSRSELIQAGVEAPDFAALIWKDGKKQPFRLSDYRGKKILVIDMWATWCGPCLASLPHLSKVADMVKDQDVEVLALNVFDDQKAFQSFMEENRNKYHFTWARDPAGRESAGSFVKVDYKVSGIPATFVIDKQGKLTAVISGYKQGDKDIELALQKLGVKVD